MNWTLTEELYDKLDSAETELYAQYKLIERLVSQGKRKGDEQIQYHNNMIMYYEGVIFTLREVIAMTEKQAAVI